MTTSGPTSFDIARVIVMNEMRYVCTRPELPAWPKRRKKETMIALIGLRCSDSSVRMSLVSVASLTTSSRERALPSTTSERSSKTGLSFRLNRTHRANSMITALPMKGMRQPHSITSLSSITASRIAQIAEANSVPQLVPRATSEAMMPRRLSGAYSDSITPAPEISAPAPKPWARRRMTRRIGARMPTCW